MTCAFRECGDGSDCCLVGGCVKLRFPVPAPGQTGSDLEAGARKLAGTQPRASRDPRFVKRRRKALTT